MGELRVAEQRQASDAETELSQPNCPALIRFGEHGQHVQRRRWTCSCMTSAQRRIGTPDRIEDPMNDDRYESSSPLDRLVVHLVAGMSAGRRMLGAVYARLVPSARPSSGAASSDAEAPHAKEDGI